MVSSLMASRKDFVTRVIKIFNLRPDDLNSTPKIFCEVYGFCQFTTTTLRTTTPEYTIQGRMMAALESYIEAGKIQ